MIRGKVVQVYNQIIEKIETVLLNRINVDRYLPLQLDITNACNLKCVHCYHEHHSNDGALSLNDWKLIIGQYKGLVTKMRYRPMVIFCGGEPMASPFLMPLIEFARNEMPLSRISILTNGTLISESNVRRFGNFKDLHFQVSLDGPDAERHDKIRGTGNFAKATRGIKLLQASGISFSVLSVLSKKTAAWMEDFFILAKNENFQSINFVRLVGEGFGRKLVEDELDEPLLGIALKEAYQKILKLSLKYQISSKAQGPLFELLIPGLGRSGRFWESIVVDYQGYVVASSRAKIRLGHALTEGIASIFLTHTIYQSLRSGKVDVCGRCEHFGVCGGDRNAAYAATGDFLGADPGCWKNLKETELRSVL
jgi:MoaA/NifB/PqqE/SkfB family radical SAM enzyme